MLDFSASRRLAEATGFGSAGESVEAIVDGYRLQAEDVQAALFYAAELTRDRRHMFQSAGLFSALPWKSES